MEPVYNIKNYDLGDVKHGYTPQFQYTLENTVIPDGVKPGCGGCTFPRLQPNGDILGYIVVNNAIGRDKDSGELRTGVFSKTINVYLPDGKPLDILNSKKVKITNPNKTKIILNISGNVIK